MAAMRGATAECSHIGATLFMPYLLTSYQKSYGDNYQGIGRYEPDRVFARGIEDLRSLADMLGEQQFWHGEKPGRTDAAIYGFIANILFYEIETPLKQYVQLRPNLVRHCRAMHERVS